MSGWETSRLDDTCEFYSAFLGRFSKGDSALKTYTSLPKDSSGVVVNFDFYEIDKWRNGVYYNDKLVVKINNIVIDLGLFDEHVDEGTVTGPPGDHPISGVTWKYTSDPIENPECFSLDHSDQIHHVEITVRKTSFTSGGTVDLEFQTQVNSLDTKSSGFDNIVISPICPNDPIGGVKDFLQDSDKDGIKNGNDHCPRTVVGDNVFKSTHDPNEWQGCSGAQIVAMECKEEYYSCPDSDRETKAYVLCVKANAMNVMILGLIDSNTKASMIADAKNCD